MAFQGSDSPPSGSLGPSVLSLSFLEFFFVLTQAPWELCLSSLQLVKEVDERWRKAHSLGVRRWDTSPYPEQSPSRLPQRLTGGAGASKTKTFTSHVSDSALSYLQHN